MLAVSAMSIVHGKSCTNSPMGPVSIFVSGKSMAAVLNVETTIGTNSSRVETAAEYQHECRCDSELE